MKTNGIITYLIFSIWGLLLVMGVLTILSPDWLSDLSDPGKNIEAISMKNAGDTFLKLNKYPQAIAEYTAALIIVPDLKSAIANLAVAYQKTGNFNNAIISFNHLLTLSPEYPGVIYYNLGEIYEKTGQPEKAISSYLAAADTSAFPEKSYQKAGHLLMGQKKWTEAIHHFKKAIDNRKDLKNSYKGMLLKYQKAYPDTSMAYIEITELLETKTYLNNLSKYDEEIFNNNLSNDIPLAKTYNNTGYCLAMLEKYNEASHYLKIAIEINPSYAEAINNLKVVNSFMNDKSMSN